MTDQQPRTWYGVFYSCSITRFATIPTLFLWLSSDLSMKLVPHNGCPPNNLFLFVFLLNAWLKREAKRLFRQFISSPHDLDRTQNFSIVHIESHLNKRPQTDNRLIKNIKIRSLQRKSGTPHTGIRAHLFPLSSSSQDACEASSYPSLN